MSLNLNVNGQPRSVEADGQTPLLWVIREELGLTGVGRVRDGGVGGREDCRVVDLDGQPLRPDGWTHFGGAGDGRTR